jgi:putative membrane protein
VTTARENGILDRGREGEAMGRLLVRWFISALALLAAAWLVPGIRVEGNAWAAYAGMALILGLVNAVIRPLLKLLTCPLILLTLGLFVLVVNALSLLIAARIAAAIGIGFHVDGFLPAVLGALIVSVVTVILRAVAREKN